MNNEKMFFAIRFNDDSREYEVIEAQAITINEAFQKMVTEYSLRTTGRSAFTVNHLTDNCNRAQNWADDENDGLRCDDLAATRFEFMAYGSRDDN